MSTRPAFRKEVPSSTDRDNLLASNQVVKTIGVQISAAAVDAGSYFDPANGKVLRRGLLLGKIDATNLYAQFNSDGNDGTENSENVVVLAENVDLRDLDGQTYVDAVAYLQGTFNKDEIYGDLAGLDKEEVQRLIFLPL